MKYLLGFLLVVGCCACSLEISTNGLKYTNDGFKGLSYHTKAGDGSERKLGTGGGVFPEQEVK